MKHAWSSHAPDRLPSIRKLKAEIGALPTLRHGERQGDLLSTQPAEPFALAVEEVINFQARQDADAQREKDRQASDLLQMNFADNAGTAATPLKDART